MSNPDHEVVTISAGQAGAQVSAACWELFCLEHGIRPDGFPCTRYKPSDDFYGTFFMLSQTGKFTPRTVIIDSEPTVIDKIRIGPYKDLFNPQFLITGKKDAANNYARGYYAVGREMINITMDRIRKMCESCSNMNGFFFSRSCAGGTGSGFVTLLLERLSDEYAKKQKFGFIVHTAPNISSVVVEPYNAVLTTHGTLNHEDCCFIVDNEALYDICARNLKVQRPMFTDLNRLQAQAISNITSSMRFKNGLNLSLDEMRTNLIPFPRIHFALVSYAPIVSSAEGMYKSLDELTPDCFHPDNYLAKCDPRYGIYMSCCLLYRGEVNLAFVKKQIKSLEDNAAIRFVRWSPSRLKIGINSRPVTRISSSNLTESKVTVTCLSNNTIVKNTWSRLMHDKFEPMYKKRAFIHHYLDEDMEEDVFKNAQDNILTLIKDYEEAETV